MPVHIGVLGRLKLSVHHVAEYLGHTKLGHEIAEHRKEHAARLEMVRDRASERRDRASKTLAHAGHGHHRLAHAMEHLGHSRLAHGVRGLADGLMHPVAAIDASTFGHGRPFEDYASFRSELDEFHPGCDETTRHVPVDRTDWDMNLAPGKIVDATVKAMFAKHAGTVVYLVIRRGRTGHHHRYARHLVRIDAAASGIHNHIIWTAA